MEFIILAFWFFTTKSLRAEEGQRHPFRFSINFYELLYIL